MLPPDTLPPLIFNINKPKGMTSTDVVRYFKKNLPTGFGKIGHFGTLDPFASGVLLLGVAGAARLNDFVHRYLPKTYLAVGRLGISSPTGDLEVAEEELTHQEVDFSQGILSFDLAQIEKDLQRDFLGKYCQTPPHFSAAKHNGKALYQWAREGVKVTKPPVERFIHSLDIISQVAAVVTFRVTVSSGTYIRTLFEDMAKKWGTIGVLAELTRERIGHVTLDKSLNKEDWPVMGRSHNQLPFEMKSVGLSMDEVLPLSKLLLSTEQAKKYSHGTLLNMAELELSENKRAFSGTDLFWVESAQGKLMGLARQQASNLKSTFNLPGIDQLV